MCGLIGAVVTADSNVARRVRTGLSTLSHRGPDHQEMQSFTLDGHEVCLGHARLSIIDLHDEANQPMSSEDGRFVLIFNGEIYNYIELRDELRATGAVFRTQSDTEVLLKAWARWGKTCLEKFDGMFAFALLDKTDKTLICARDPFGIKPLFYSVSSQGLFFASELPAVLRLLPARPTSDLQRAYDYLVHGDYDSDERTFVEGVHHVMPGEVLTFDVGSGPIKSIHRWWRPGIAQTSTLSFKDAVEAVRMQFLQNVRRQLRSDVPLGAALSGGIDSSAVVCAMRYLEPTIPIHTFSYVASDPSISEERWIDLVNQHVGAIPHKVRAGAEDLARDLDDLVNAQGEPFGSTSIYAQYRVFRLARENGITVTLDGQGADEMLAGYIGYPGQRLRSLLETGEWTQAWRFFNGWSKWPARSRMLAAKWLASEVTGGRTHQMLRRIHGTESVPSWIHAGPLRDAGVCLESPHLRPEDDTRGRRVMAELALSLTHRGLPALLRHGDRNSMRFSLESRVPFLTIDLVNLLLSLPEEYLVSPDGETKHVFRAAMRGIVPDAILDRRDKIGFATPEQAWLLSMSDVVRRWLASDIGLPFFDNNVVVKLFDRIAANKTPLTWQTWRWINFCRWYQKFVV